MRNVRLLDIYFTFYYKSVLNQASLKKKLLCPYTSHKFSLARCGCSLCRTGLKSMKHNRGFIYSFYFTPRRGEQ